MKLTFSESYCQILQMFSTGDGPGNTSFCLRCQLTLISIYWVKCKVFDFNMLLRYLLFFVMITSICLSQISLTNQK